MTRLTCLDCTTLTAEHGVDTVDLDSQCIWEEFTREHDGKEHKNSHRLLQIRKSTPHRKIHGVMSRAQSMLEDLDSAILHTDETGMLLQLFVYRGR